MENDLISKKDSGSVTLRKSTLWKVGVFIFAALFVISLFTGGFGIGNATGSAIDPSAPSAPSPSIPTGIASVNAEDFVDDDPFIGDENAPITMIEFSDFQCPFCKRFRDQAFDQLKSQYIDAGKVKFVYRDFPLSSIHPMAQKAAEAGECADDQGKFWEMHDKIFEGQSVWASSGVSIFKQYAQELNLNSNEFDNCLDSGKYKDEVEKDLNDATRSGGQGTPYFLVGNQQISGAQPFVAFQQAIESQL
ncbi:DsbA family protein [Candidatus Woesearchaeota archaeon]|nr:DsbA family protein [Candidatus Woesearchaeota archaeon]